MNENTATPQPAESNDRYKNIVILLTILTTIFAAALAALQSDAGIRASVANRDSQYYAVLISGELHRSGLEADYQFNVFGDYLKNEQQATVLQLTALQQDEKGDKAAAQATTLLADVAQARADVGKKFSIFYNDPHYAPKTENDLPDVQQYVTDSNQAANELLTKQNQVSDSYHRWDSKSDSYVTALTILAVAFFLFGLAQAVKNLRLRLTFMIIGILVLGFSTVMTAMTLIA